MLYAVEAAFLIVKGWTRKNTSQTGKGKAEDKQKEMNERQAGEIRLIGTSQQKEGEIKRNCWNLVKLFRWRR